LRNVFSFLSIVAQAGYIYWVVEAVLAVASRAMRWWLRVAFSMMRT
jgi:hypothetical protein